MLNKQELFDKYRNYKLIYIAVVFFIVALLLLIAFYNKLFYVDVNTDLNDEAVDILFIGNLENRVAIQDDIFKYLDLIYWDKVVLIGDFNGKDDKVASLIHQKKSTVINLGNQDNVAFVKDGVQYIYIGNSNINSCMIDDNSVEWMKKQLEKGNDYLATILVVDKTLWSYSNSHIVDSSCENSEYWDKTIHPLIKDSVDIVISSNGYAFDYYIKDNIRYVINGLPKHDRDNYDHLYFTRVQVNKYKGILINKLELTDPRYIDESVFDDIDTVRVKMDQDDLEKIYSTVPSYDLLKWIDNWKSEVETYNSEEIKQVYKATVITSDDEYEAEIKLRGDVGNHWAGLKKSWTISDPQKKHRKLKLIIPSDRLFLLANIDDNIFKYFDVITPELNFVHLYINDYDMGLYLQYEDIDKAFLEIRGYNSDAPRAENADLDIYNGSPMYKNLNFLEVQGEEFKHDRSIWNRILFKDLDPNMLDYYYDVDNAAKWLAMQFYFQDTHQNENDNFRAFIDLSTGRINFITWDIWLREWDPNKNILINGWIQQKLFENNKIRTRTLEYLCEMVNDTDNVIKINNETVFNYKKYYVNDPLIQYYWRGSIPINYDTLLFGNKSKIFEQNKKHIYNFIKENGGECKIK